MIAKEAKDAKVLTRLWPGSRRICTLSVGTRHEPSLVKTIQEDKKQLSILSVNGEEDMCLSEDVAPARVTDAQTYLKSEKAT